MGLKSRAKIWVPLAIVLLGVLVAVALVASRRPPKTALPAPPTPVVRAVQVSVQPVELTVASQGTVRPRTETALVPEVGGRVIWVSEQCVAGGTFERHDVLLRIDPADYQAAVEAAVAQVKQAELRVAREEGEAAIAARDWQELGTGEPSALTLRQPQLAGAKASLAAAKAALGKARRDLARSELRAPFAGRVRAEQVDIGQVLIPGQPVGAIYATDVAEVRLPIRDHELAFLELQAGRGDGPAVQLRGDFAGEARVWEGRIVRSEGELDPETRMVHLVAQVEDPYDESQAHPLPMGLYVEATVRGRTLEHAVVLPREALRTAAQVWVVDADTLRFRQVSVVQSTRERVVIDQGLADGEWVCLSNLDTPIDGMPVRLSAAEPGQ